MLLQSYLNKWRISQLSKLDKLYNNSAPDRLLKRSKNYSIEYTNQMCPNNLHIHLRACNESSLYHFLSPMTESNIP